MLRIIKPLLVSLALHLAPDLLYGHVVLDTVEDEDKFK